ncbi:MAG: TRAP transporter substrate-binding protein DctP [Proteobacteria bacterium]|nr:TRAP transporter substrate-binding protein DctP [Pseudomonadota bacterium]MBU1744192.1 TRAP transporter substrate-binding protein DctP [Pseudomonadota bacterium]MBU1966151.1 TRAP transporter substrate-binding protein DctP [Pseudomonadota bacterium]
MNYRKVSVVVAVFFLCLVFGWSQIYAQVKPVGLPMTIKISHQWPGGTIDKGDFRDRLSRLFAQKVGEKTGGALKFEIYPASALFKPGPQYDAMLKGALDMSVYPLDYAAGKIPQFSITLMPAVVKDHNQAMRWKDAPIGKEIEKLSEENGMKIITWAWCGGGMAGKAKPLIKPDDMQKVKIRAAGKMFEKMLHASGAGISSMPSSEIYFALQTGVLDACMTSSSSFASYRLYEQVKYYTSPRITTTWYMLEPLAMSMVTWKKLSPEQQKIVVEVGRELEKFALEEAIRDDTDVTDLFKSKGVIVHDMTPDELKVWAETAKNTAWKEYSEKVKGGKELLKMALDVK